MKPGASYLRVGRAFYGPQDNVYRTMKNHGVPGLLILTVAVLLTGCGTLIHGARQEVFINSEPEGAEVFLNDEAQGATPLTLELDRADRYLLRVEHEGYAPQARRLARRADAWSIAGLVLWGPFGPVSMGIDWATGAVYTQQPDAVFIRLTRAP